MICKHTRILITLVLVGTSVSRVQADCYAHTIFVPRQITYNPIYEDALVFDEYAHMAENEDCFLFSLKPIYTRTVGDSLKEYFNINHLCSMSIKEDGSGNIDPLWFQVISAPDTFYSSTLSFNPVQKTYGGMLYCAWLLPEDFAITVNTAIVRRTTDMQICETNITTGDLGQASGFTTLTQALMNPDLQYGRVCCSSLVGVDDVQIKFLKNFTLCEDDSLFGDIYALLGVPTGHGSKARYLFEPIVGSNHVQIGFGLNAEKSFDWCLCDRFSLYGELKWRYGFNGTETRSFDMKPNGQWSRYMLFTTPLASAEPFPAINDLTFKVTVTPRNSFDLLLAAHAEHDAWSFEVGYNFWYRQSEKVCPCIDLPNVGIADLVGIAQLANQNPVMVTTASMATISEGVFPNKFQMPHDATYTFVTTKNINAYSGVQPTSLSNAVFGAIGYHCDPVDLGINVSYEGAANSNTASVVSVWANIDIRF